MHLTPEQVIERLLAGDLAQPTIAGNELEFPVLPAGSEESLAAVHRLVTLFADVVIPDLAQALTDAMIALANADQVPLTISTSSVSRYPDTDTGWLNSTNHQVLTTIADGRQVG